MLKCHQYQRTGAFPIGHRTTIHQSYVGKSNCDIRERDNVPDSIEVSRPAPISCTSVKVLLPLYISLDPPCSSPRPPERQWAETDGQSEEE